MLEKFVLVEIVARLNTEQSTMITEVARNMYDDVAQLSSTSNVGEKENKQIERKLKEIFIADHTRHRTFEAQMKLFSSEKSSV